MSKVLELRRKDLERKRTYIRECDNCESVIEYTADDCYGRAEIYPSGRYVSCPVCGKQYKWDDVVFGGTNV